MCFVVKSLLGDFDRWCCARCVYCVIVVWMCILNRPPWLRVQLEWLAWARSVPIVLWFALHGCVFNWSGWRGRGPSHFVWWLIVIVIWYLVYTNCVIVKVLVLFILFITVIIIYTMSYCVWLVSNLWHLTNLVLTYFSIVFRYFKWE